MPQSTPSQRYATQSQGAGLSAAGPSASGPASIPASGPASSPTSGRATPSQERPSQRARLTDEEKLVLVRLCVNYQDEHTRGNKANFWIKIKQLLKDETGKELKNLQDTIRLMSTTLEVQDRREQRESGTVQQDTDLNQALRQWLEHENEVKDQEKRKKSAAEESVQKEAEEAEKHRRNLLLPKHKRPADTDSESLDASDNTKAIRTLKKKRQNKRKQQEREESESRRLREDM